MNLSLVAQTLTVISESSPSLESQSKVSSKTSSKRADTEAELAAKIEQAKAMQEISDQQVGLQKIENDWKLNDAKMLAEIKQRETEVSLRLEEERERGCSSRKSIQ